MVVVAGVDAVDVRWVAAEGIEDHQVKDLKALLERDGGFTWVDVPTCDAERLRAGRLRPASPFELSYAIVSALVRSMAELVRSLAGAIAALVLALMLGVALAMLAWAKRHHWW
jgi:hypothetical protein